MRRLLIQLPAVARRSPAMITPSAYRTATHVVPWAIWVGSNPAVAGIGTVPDRLSNSAKSGPGSDPGVKNGIAMGWLLAALLDVGLHEVLGVGLEHVIDLVQQVVQ